MLFNAKATPRLSVLLRFLGTGKAVFWARESPLFLAVLLRLGEKGSVFGHERQPLRSWPMPVPDWGAPPQPFQ